MVRARSKNIPFEGGKIAVVAAIGENSLENLVVEVRDESGKLIEPPPSLKGRFLVVWLPNKSQSVNVTVHNHGAEQKVAFLANWD
jgi:hypothetical protein